MAISSIDITNASISQLQDALSTGATTSVELVARFLHRIGKYDFRGPSLNSICVLNPDVFKEAQNSDDYRASGHPPRSLEGIPFTVKDSFSVKGLTVAAASPAFTDLIASSDAAVVESLRAAGAILIGKTNMPPMADGGSQRGAYGRSTSPYNPEYLPTSFASGSSYGSGVATSCSFAPIGLGGETVSSGRAPASHNALVGYSPSRGVIPARGQWPLYPTCDVVVPHAKSMEDLFAILNAIINDDTDSFGDFWRSQPTVPIPSSSAVRPQDYLSLMDPTALKGKRIAVPKCYIGQPTSSGYTATFSDATSALWHRAAADLESLGATLVPTDTFPLVDNYARQLFPGQAANVPDIPASWIDTERCELIAVAWDDFLRRNADPHCCPDGLVDVDHKQINPGFAPMDDPAAFTETQNHVRYAEMVDFVRSARRPRSVYDLPGCADALRALEAARKRDLEEWMDANGFDLLAFPTNGDVGRAEAEEDEGAMRDALREGVKYSNGGRALKHLGVPAVTVPMGVLEGGSGMPVGLTFAGRAYGDSDLLRCAFAYETATRRRTGPPLAPGLETDVVMLGGAGVVGSEKPRVVVEWSDVTKRSDGEFEIRDVSLGGTVRCEGSSVAIEGMEAFVNGEESATVTLKGDSWEWNAQLKRPHVRDKYPTPGKIPRDQFMIVFLARASNGRSTGILLLED